MEKKQKYKKGQKIWYGNLEGVIEKDYGDGVCTVKVEGEIKGEKTGRSRFFHDVKVGENDSDYCRIRYF